ncbi:MAG TPA: response regulator transcription factor [Polyangia bacterium]
MRVVIVDDHRMLAGALAFYLRAGGIEIAGQAATGPRGVDLAQTLTPNIVLMDAHLERRGMSGFEATRRIVQSSPSVRVLGMSGHRGEAVGAQMIRAGALGFLVKDQDLCLLLPALRAVAAGQTFLDPRLADGITRCLGSGDAATEVQLCEALTPREQEVLEYVAAGASIKATAAALGLRRKTIDRHRQSIMDKLDIHSAAGLTRAAVEAEFGDVARASGGPGRQTR